MSMVGKGRRRGSRRGLAVLAAAGMAGMGQLAVATSALAAPVIGCGMAAQLDFSPNGPGASGTFGWSLQGSIAGCQSDATGVATGGVITSGGAYTASVPITLADGSVVQGTAKYQESAGSAWSTVSGTNSCGSSEFFNPDVFFQWSDGTVTEATISMIAIGPILEYDGSATNGANMPLIPGTEHPRGTAPPNFVVFSDNPNIEQGETYSGVAVLATSNPLNCATAQGVESAFAAGGFQFDLGPNIPKP
jgi:hypothetical protein